MVRAAKLLLFLRVVLQNYYCSHFVPACLTAILARSFVRSFAQIRGGRFFSRAKCCFAEKSENEKNVKK